MSKSLVVLAVFLAATCALSAPHLSSLREIGIPDAFDWNNIDGKSMLTYVRNQMAPRFCDSGWAFSVASSMSDRIKIKRNSSGPDIIISPQVLVSCDSGSDGCRGGSATSAYEYILQNSITDETCSPYTGKDSSNGYGCSAKTICLECWPEAGCNAKENAFIYSISSWKTLSGEEQMKQEILNNGPITCVIGSTHEFRNYQSGIILSNSASLSSVNHTVSVVGWGVESSTNTAYWVVRNSVGSFWGENGFVKIQRGSNTLNIESECSSAEVVDTWTEGIRNTTSISVEPNQHDNKFGSEILQTLTDNARKVYAETINKFQEGQEKFAELLPEALKHVSESDPVDLETIAKLPAAFNWGDVNGINYLTALRNQHNPQYCGGCWSFAGTSSLMDRIKIMRNNTGGAPDVMLSNQMIINCHYGGSCVTGGITYLVYYFLHKHGVTEDSCMPYQAKDDLPWFTCTAQRQCSSCSLPSEPVSKETPLPESCPAETAYPIKKWYVDKFGHIAGAKAMKAEIYARGPIACTIDATDALETTYTGGIYSEKLKFPVPNHYISVIGWGVSEEGEEYWIARNSWGTYWGENGFFRLKMHSDNLGVEGGCSWATPILH